jgi:hypothetical protein
MRKFGLLAVSGALILMSVAWVEGQQGGNKGNPFQQTSPLFLINREDVKKELDITQEQLDKLPAEVMVAISKVLDQKQFKRFKEIDLQQRGNNAFKDTAVQKALNMTDEQKTNITSLLTDSDKEIKDLRGKGGKGGKGGGTTEKVDTIRKETKEKILGVLTKEQRKTFRELVGEEFKFQQFTFPGTKKKDAE